MNRIEKIQLILEEFYNPKNLTANHNLIFSEFSDKLEAKDIHEIIYKLEKDGFLTHLDWYTGGVGGNITFEGGLFYDNGGYIENERRIKAETNRQVMINIIVALGTGLAGIYALVQLVMYIFVSYCSC